MFLYGLARRITSSTRQRSCLDLTGCIQIDVASVITEDRLQMAVLVRCVWTTTYVSGLRTNSSTVLVVSRSQIFYHRVIFSSYSNPFLVHIKDNVWYCTGR